jgi:hypothetical protein
MSKSQITKEQFQLACLTSKGPGEVIKKLGGCDNGAWRRKIRILQNKFGIEIPIYHPPRKYKITKKECPVCKKLFKTSLGNRDEKTVCSKSCSNTYFRSGVNNPNYKNGCNGDKEYRIICFSHHEKKCVICGFDYIVEVHHNDCNKQNNSPENLIPLCPNHHKMFHSRHKHLVSPLIEDYIKTTGCSRKV